MSTIRTFDVPHIFRFGRRDEAKGETWQLFYRNAACFTIDIKRDDIAGTPFERAWSEYCVEARRPDWIQHYNDFCDLVSRHNLSLLQTVAPVGRYQWVTLEDYLQTPRYKLRMFKEDGADDAIAKIIEGPTTIPAFEMVPQPFSKLDNIPPDFPRIAAADVTVLDHEQDLRVRPQKVRVTDTGAVYALICALGPSTATETGISTNESVRAMSRLFKKSADLEPSEGSSRPFAIVTTMSYHPAHRGQSPELLRVAGLLHTLES